METVADFILGAPKSLQMVIAAMKLGHFFLGRKAMTNLAAAAAKSLQSCPTLHDPTDSSPPGSSVPGIFQASTGVGCHFLLQCMKVKSEGEVAQSCPTLRDPMDCSLPGSSIHGISRQEYWSGLPLPSLNYSYYLAIERKDKLTILRASLVTQTVDS